MYFIIQLSCFFIDQDAKVHSSHNEKQRICKRKLNLKLIMGNSCMLPRDAKINSLESDQDCKRK